MSETPPRPSHTTLAAGLVIGGSVGVVVGVAQQLAGLHSLETREAVGSFLSEPPGSGLGLDVPQALEMLRVALMVVAGCATAAAVLGYHVLQRSHRARLGLSLLAIPIFLGGLATGGFLTSLVAAAALLLWVGPSGAWFRGEQPSRRPSTSSPVSWPQAPERGPAAESPPSEQRPAPSLPMRPPAPRPRSRRPDALVWACVLTWAQCSITLVVLVASAVLMASNPDLVLDELRRQGREVPAGDVGLLRTTTYVTVAVAGTWTVAAMGVAVAAYRRARWARIALLVSAAVAAVLCLLAATTTLPALVPGLVCLATVVLLNRPDVRAWYMRT